MVGEEVKCGGEVVKGCREGGGGVLKENLWIYVQLAGVPGVASEIKKRIFKKKNMVFLYPMILTPRVFLKKMSAHSIQPFSQLSLYIYEICAICIFSRIYGSDQSYLQILAIYIFIQRCHILICRKKKMLCHEIPNTFVSWLPKDIKAFYNEEKKCVAHGRLPSP